MIETALALTLHLTTAADTCADRACFVAAAKSCSPATFTVPTADLFHMLEGSVGTTRVEVDKKAGGCSLHFRVHVDRLPAPQPGVTFTGTLEKANASAMSDLSCEGSAAELATLAEKLGTDQLLVRDLVGCFATRCDPVPPLDIGCTAGPCVKGSYDVSCGDKKCKMSGMADKPDFPVLYYCTGDGPHSIGVKTPSAPPPAKKSSKK